MEKLKTIKIKIKLKINNNLKITEIKNYLNLKKEELVMSKAHFRAHPKIKNMTLIILLTIILLKFLLIVAEEIHRAAKLQTRA